MNEEALDSGDSFLAFEYESGVEYTGEWDDQGLRHGLGQMLFTDGTRFVGNFKEGLASGLGSMWFPDGSRYLGEFLQGWFHGCGAFKRKDGMLFEGEFRGGRVWGHGLLTFCEWNHGYPRHEGYFQDCRFVSKENCKRVILKARTVVSIARNLADQWPS